MLIKKRKKEEIEKEQNCRCLIGLAFEISGIGVPE